MVTVLGAGGFIGSRLTSYLGKAGYDLYAPGRNDPDIFRYDLGTVIYSIGLTADFRKRPYETVEAHTGYLSRILENATYSSLTYLSSTRVYHKSDRASEDSVLQIFPDSDGLYNLTKLTGEALCLHNGKCNVARLSNIVGEDASESFVAQLIAAAETGSVLLRSSLKSAKDYLLVEDAVKALIAIANSGTNGIYNVASGYNITTAEIIEALKTRFNFQTSVIESAPEFSFPPIDTSKLARLTDWYPNNVIQWLKSKKTTFKYL